jgi:excisionase family DNA binding protein
MEATRDEVTVSEAARRFGVSARTVTNMIRAGVIKARRPTGAKRGMYRIPESEIARHLAESEVVHQSASGQLPEPAAA